MPASFAFPRKGVSTTLAVFAALLLGLLAAAAPASAARLEVDLGTGGDSQEFYGCDAKVGDTYSMGCFNDNGDVFYVADWERDGMRVAVYWKLPGKSRHGLCVSVKGPGWVPTVGWVGTRVACNKDLPEGKRVLIRSGRCDGTVHSCKKLRHYQDWTAWDAATV